MNIYYNSLEPLTSVQSQVQSTIDNYAANIEFDSVFKTNAMIDALQQLPFINDAQWTTLQAKPHTASTYTNFTWTYASLAGYLNVDWTSSVINYIAQ